MQENTSKDVSADDSMAKKLNKSADDDNPTERIEIEKIQLPEGINQEEGERGSSLFKGQLSFAYETSAIKNTPGILGNASSPDPNGVELHADNNEGHNSSILDKYKDRIKKHKEEKKDDVPDEKAKKESRRELRRQQTIKKRQYEKEMLLLRENVEIWGEKIDKMASCCRLIFLISITILVVIFLFFMFRQFGNNKFIVYVILEYVEEAIIALLSFLTIRIVSMSDVDFSKVLFHKYVIIIACSLHGVMIILGFVFMDYGGGIDLGASTRMELSDALLKVLGIVYLIINFGKCAIFAYWLYLYLKYIKEYKILSDKYGDMNPPEESQKEQKEENNSDKK
eukprot:TRINITY_DN13820_c0_g1_i1.p1 TRINITY_DN13820_c0_g1~~TRINITY_DN13820_c0_g1_i1.p1  ORF type:complete len:339 (-),score=64.66 TRINITY_DN13820_c0_g1_i1:45-1061(-)